MTLVINVHFYHIFNRSLFVEETIHISHIYGSFYFLQLKSLLSSKLQKLMTSPVAPLYSNASTVTSFYISILSSQIFTVTSLSMSLFFRLQQDVLSSTLESTTNLLLLLRSNWGLSDLYPHLNYFVCFLLQSSLSDAVYTGVEVRRMDSEMSGLVERSWLQLICCAICLLCGCNFRWWGEVWDRSECWMVCRCWTPEIEFNKRLSSLIIRLANYNVTTSLIYKLIV